MSSLAQGDTVFVSTAGSNEPGLPQWVSALGQYDKDKDGRISRAELLPDKELGEHFGWIDTSDDSFVTEAEWSVARALGLGAWGSVAMTPGAARGQLPGTAVRWRFQKNVPYIPAPLLYQGVYYLVKTGGIVTTLDPATGTLLKEGRATGALGEYYASPVAADGRVYVANLEGKITVLKSGGQWEILAQNDLREEISATPALANGRLYVRTREAMYCFASRLSSRRHADRRRSAHQKVSDSIDLNRRTGAGSSRAGRRRGPPSWTRTPMLRLRRPLPHVRIVQGREHDDFRLRVRPRNLTARVQAVGVGEVEVEHNHVRLEPLHGVQDCAGVRDGSHDLAVQ